MEEEFASSKTERRDFPVNYDSRRESGENSIRNTSSSEEGVSEEEELSSEEEVDESIEGTIIREIQQGIYTCLVCLSEIDTFSKVWTCNSCFRLYDLKCIRDWAITGSTRNLENKTWKCPSCNIPRKEIPKRFTCWCGKVSDPTPNIDHPFSCGNTCDEPYPNCVHSCSAICHPGKHPICGAVGPPMRCHCGKKERQLPCLITPYKEGWTCDEPCENIVCNLGHKCSIRECHLGYCGPCKEMVEVRCYCGKNYNKIVCHERFPKRCFLNSQEYWIGQFPCKEKTEIYFDCGKHKNDVTCQPLPSKVQVCPFSPSQVTTCYCGKTKVDPFERKSCSDPIPECGSVCGKLLPCGCRCLFKCHQGECRCANVLDIKCRCENYSFLVPCQFLRQGYRPKCKHKCPVLLSCRRHHHNEVCCAYEQTALTRERVKRKAVRRGLRASMSDDHEVMTVEPAHICTRTCNRLRSCGRHYCDALCHSGPCSICLESSSSDLPCHCGKTVIPAPVRCGTKIECHEQCVREKPCGHKQEPHECHGDDSECPRCTEKVTKRCNCGLKEVSNVMCSQENISCGTTCRQPMECGHPCLKVCSQTCTKSKVHAHPKSCTDFCRKRRSTCPHYCKEKCHYRKAGMPASCDKMMCTDLVHITCQCERKSVKVPCGASLTLKSKIGETLECDDICMKRKRNAELKAALSVSDEEDKGSLYSEFVIETFKKQSNWCARIENFIRSFVSERSMDKDNETLSFSNCHYFSPMSKPQRRFIHELASSYKLYSESQDTEPNRSVFIIIVKSTDLPQYSISEAIEIQKKVQEPPPPIASSNNDEHKLYNSILVQDVFLGVSGSQVEEAYRDVVSHFDIEQCHLKCIKDNTYLLYSNTWYRNMDLNKENRLYLFSKRLRELLRSASIAFDCKLCLINDTADSILQVERSLSRNLKKEHDLNQPKEIPFSHANSGFSILENL